MAVHCTTSSPTTAVASSAAPYTRLPLEIELYIVQALIELHKRSKNPGFRLSTFATVSKAWQARIEKETYKRIKISAILCEFRSFQQHVRSYRKPHVRHIVLEIPFDISRHGDNDQVIFSIAVHILWRLLSRWNTHRVTVELGIVPKNPRPSWLNNPHNYPFNPLKTLNPELMARWNDWVIVSEYLLGIESVYLDPTFFPPGVTSLPQVDAIAELVIRREYHPNFAPITLHEIISSAPCIESIHLERWCYGVLGHDTRWDHGMYLSCHSLLQRPQY